MDIQAKLAELRAWSRSGARKAAYLAAKDFDYWVHEIESANKEGRRFFQDSDWVWYVHMYRSNELYCQALSALLGDGFKVEIGVGHGSDTIEEYTYHCVKVSW